MRLFLLLLHLLLLLAAGRLWGLLRCCACAPCFQPTITL
jgi:hypothetical protein